MKITFFLDRKFRQGFIDQKKKASSTILRNRQGDENSKSNHKETMNSKNYLITFQNSLEQQHAWEIISVTPDSAILLLFHFHQQLRTTYITAILNIKEI